MKKILKYTGYSLLVFAGLLLIFIAANWKHVASFPSIISSYYAKEFCSCYYVTGRDEEFCHNYTRQYVPISEFEHDKEKKKITVSGLGRTNSASFRDKKTGCAYDE